MKIALSLAVVAVLAIPGIGRAQAAPPSSQGPVTAPDLQRLEDDAYNAGASVSRVRERDQTAADRLQQRLDEAREEIVYLKVKLRKDGTVTRREYNDLRDRIAAIGADAEGPGSNGGSTWTTNSNGTPPPPPPGAYGAPPESPMPPQARQHGELPEGQELDVRIERPLSSETAQVEDRFTATTVVDLYQDNEVLVPAGATLRGVVSSVNKATHTDRRGSMTLAFDQITVRGRTYPLHATVTQALQAQSSRADNEKIGAGAGVGMILGGILGGAKGALLGILVGGGGTMAATEGQDVVIPPGTVLRVRLDAPVVIRPGDRF